MSDPTKPNETRQEAVYRTYKKDLDIGLMVKNTLNEQMEFSKFVQVWIPYLIDYFNGTLTKEEELYWMHRVGNPRGSLDIVDDTTGEILFATPPILSRNVEIISNDKMMEYLQLMTFDNHQRRNFNTANTTVEDHLKNSIEIKVYNDAKNKKWREIFKRCGVSDELNPFIIDQNETREETEKSGSFLDDEDEIEDYGF